jgi:hypothetical protein
VIATCGLEDCTSPCHAWGPTAGRYCAPLRCYCGGCPAYVPVERSSGPVTQEELDARVAAEAALAAARRAAAVPLDQAPAEVLAIRDQLRAARAEAMGQVAWQALQDRRERDHRG